MLNLTTVGTGLAVFGGGSAIYLGYQGVKALWAKITSNPIVADIEARVSALEAGFKVLTASAAAPAPAPAKAP